MKELLKSRAFTIIVTACVCIAGTAYAAVSILASNITYKNTTVDKALNDLYEIADEYVKLESKTTVLPSNLLSGITAYDGSGKLITGTLLTNQYSTYYLVDGANGSMSELNLQNNTYSKFKYSELSCSSGNTATVYAYDNTYSTKTVLNIDTWYDISNLYHRLFFQKTGGSSWCQIKISFSN
ncbi:MAG: hypothetical protein IJ715_03105 [Bacilli bacterium]|nr:hypothetical protein [Bacilli bacterium]